ncbi:glutamate--tRNA ligase [Binucleata daphniae]
MNYKIDLSLKKEPVYDEIIEQNNYTNNLIKFVSAGYNEIDNILQVLENEYKDEYFDITFYFLYTNFVFVGLLKKNKFAEYKKINKIYNDGLCKFESEIKEFHDLKATKETSKTLTDTEIMMKNSQIVVTRFPPEPSGFLHLGHAKAALLNNHFARENKGKLIVRFDDTNPIKEEQLYVDAIMSDLNNLLDIKEDQLSYTSDYFDVLIDFAIKLIESGDAYVDDTDLEKMRYERGEGIESKNRDKDVEENLSIFNEMIKGEVTNYCLRAKIDMKSVNKAMRDPVIYRHVNTPHHRTDSKYKIYPTYDFCCPVIDSIENVTHTLRTNEYRDRNDQYFWFIKTLKLTNIPKIKDFSRLNFENTVLSKRKLKKIVEEQNISWDDPRMPTLRGIKKLGMNFDVLKEYILLQGVSQKTCKVSWDKIWALNKKRIDLESGKYFGINKKDIYELNIENFEELKEHKQEEQGNIIQKDLMSEVKRLNINADTFYYEMHKNKKNLELGVKKVKVKNVLYLPDENYKVNNEITLMNLGNFVIKHIENRKITCKYNKNGSYKDTTMKVQWVCSKNYVECVINEYSNLCLNDDGDYNTDSKKSHQYICEKEVKFLEPNTVIQLERIGFFYFDGKEYNLVPFTKQTRKENKK